MDDLSIKAKGLDIEQDIGRT